MKNLFVYNIFLMLLVSCSTDSNTEYSKPLLNSEILKLNMFRMIQGEKTGIGKVLWVIDFKTLF